MIVQLSKQQYAVLLEVLRGSDDGRGEDLATIIESRGDDIAQVVEVWVDRCKTQGYSPKKQKDRQADFFTGAMAARHAAGVENWAPPGWCVDIMSGDLIT